MDRNRGNGCGCRGLLLTASWPGARPDTMWCANWAPSTRPRAVQRSGSQASKRKTFDEHIRVSASHRRRSVVQRAAARASFCVKSTDDTESGAAAIKAASCAGCGGAVVAKTAFENAEPTARPAAATGSWIAAAVYLRRRKWAVAGACQASWPRRKLVHRAGRRPATGRRLRRAAA